MSVGGKMDNSMTKSQILDALVNEFPEVYKCIGETDIDKTYSMPKQYVSYRKPRRITVPDKERRKAMMDEINKHKM